MRAIVAKGTHLITFEKNQLNIYSPSLSEIIFWSYTFVMTGLSMTDPYYTGWYNYNSGM